MNEKIAEANIDPDPVTDTGRWRAIMQQELRASEKRILDALAHDRWKFMRYVRHAINKFFGDWDGDGN